MNFFSNIGSAISKAYNTVKNVLSGSSNSASVYNAVNKTQVQTPYTSASLLNPGGLNTLNTYKPVTISPNAPGIVPQVYPGSTGSGSNQNVSVNSYGGFTPVPTTIGAGQRPLAPITFASGTSTPDYTLSSKTTTSSPISMPSAPAYSNPGTVNNAGLVNALSETKQYDPVTGLFTDKVKTPEEIAADAEKAAADERKKNLDEMVGLIPKKESVLQSPEVQAAEAERRTRQQEVNNYTAQLNSVVAKQNQDLLTLRGIGAQEGVTETVYGGQSATINREAAIKSLPIQAQIAAAQGNLQLAQDYLSQVKTIKQEQIDADYNYNMAKFTAVSGYLKGEEKIKLDKITTTETRAYETTKENLNDQDAWAKIAMDNGKSNLIAQINAIPAGDPNFKQKLGAITAQISSMASVKNQLEIQKLKNEVDAGKPITGEWANIINGVSGLVPATQAPGVKKSIVDALAGKDYVTAYSNVANAVENGLTGANATRFSASRTDIGVMSSMRDAIQEYVNTPGADLGYLKGTADTIAKKFGQLATDPKFAALGVRLEREFQTYRNEMTGAVFSPAESKSYAAVNPRTNASLDLNLATIDGALAQLNSRVESTINTRVPDAKKLKDLAKEQLNPNVFTQAIIPSTGILNTTTGLFNIPTK